MENKYVWKAVFTCLALNMLFLKSKYTSPISFIMNLDNKPFFEAFKEPSKTIKY